MPGPTGESNRLSLHPRPPVLCPGPGPQAAEAQASAVRVLGGTAVISGESLDPAALSRLTGFSGANFRGGAEDARALATCKGPILPLIVAMPDTGHVVHERHLCVDTTAAGGNATLLAEAAR